MSMPIVDYKVLAEGVANGRTYILYSGLFTSIMWAMLVSMGLLLLLNKGDVILKDVILLTIFLWPMIITLNLLVYGYVMSGDQPRLEFALGSLMVSGKTTLEQASRMSNYFYWPSTWLLEGVFSNIVGLSSF